MDCLWVVTITIIVNGNVPYLYIPFSNSRIFHVCSLILRGSAASARVILCGCCCSPSTTENRRINSRTQSRWSSIDTATDMTTCTPHKRLELEKEDKNCRSINRLGIEYSLNHSKQTNEEEQGGVLYTFSKQSSRDCSLKTRCTKRKRNKRLSWTDLRITRFVSELEWVVVYEVQFLFKGSMGFHLVPRTKSCKPHLL